MTHVVSPDPSTVVDAPPRREHVHGAFATRFQVDRSRADGIRVVQGAMYRNDGSLIDLSVRVSGVMGDHVHTADPPTVRIERAEVLRGRGLYLGNVYSHYGHFITEGLGTLWPVARGERFDYFAAHPFIFANTQPDFLVQAFRRLGIDIDRVHVLRRPTLFDDIVVPERAWQASVSVNLAFRDVVDRIRRHGEGDLKVYLSRDRIAKRPIANEIDVATAFERRGFTVVRPEELSFAEQLELYARASVIAGFAGSQLHNLLFARSGTVVISIGDGLRRPLMPNQVLCNAIRESTAIVVDFKGSGNTFDLDALDGELWAAASVTPPVTAR
ncbi:MAG TPA: glycosyltransferase family 61 protein [Candidatus Limnocylindrales bacterium]